MDPATFAKSAYVGRFGWVTVDLARVDPDLLDSLLRRRLAADRAEDASPRRWRTDVTTPDEALPEHVRRNRSGVGRVGAGVRRERRGQLAARAGRREVGDLGHPRARGPPPSGRPRRQGHDRARLRDRVRLGVAGPARRPTGRHRQLGAAARDGPAAPGRSTGSTSRCPRQRRDACRIPTRASTSRSPSTARRSGPIPYALDPRGGPPPAARRPADLPRSTRRS